MAPARFELSTSSSGVMCMTAELRDHVGKGEGGSSEPPCQDPAPREWGSPVGPFPSCVGPVPDQNKKQKNGIGKSKGILKTISCPRFDGKSFLNDIALKWPTSRPLTEEPPFQHPPLPQHKDLDSAGDSGRQGRSRPKSLPSVLLRWRALIQGGISRQVEFTVVNFAVGNFAEPPGFCVVPPP